MEHIHLLLLIVVGLQIVTIYLVLRDTRFYKDAFGKWEKAFDIWTLNEEVEAEYQKQRAAYVSEYGQYIEKCQAESATYERQVEECEREKQEWDEVLRRLKAFLDRCEDT